MRFDVLTLFPEVFAGYLDQSLVKRAQDRGLVHIHRWNIRDWSTDKHKAVDDRPYGGGPGMVLMPQPIFDCVEAVTAMDPTPGRLVMLTPQGRRLDQRLVEEFATYERLLLLCGRYEGFDERIRLGLEPLEVSIGDYILGGGELAAMVVIDAVVRLVPGVLGDELSARDESFSETSMLEYPQYTRPREFRGMRVPDVLVSGNHEQIARWRRRQALVRTRERRGDGES
jgi:tRNA (guanine37-N1)-methyltransferase